jgi:hypothetical protein
MVEIGGEYNRRLMECIRLYEQGLFEEEKQLVEKGYAINCYRCLKRIEEKHVKIENEDETIRFHKKCIEEIAKGN